MRGFDRAQVGSNLFDAAEAKHDRIKFAISVQIQLGSTEPQTYAELVTNYDASGPDILRLRSGPGYPSQFWRLTTNKDDWLFNLHGRLYRAPQSIQGRLDLELNPTRFLAHHFDPHEVNAASFEPEITLRRRSDMRSWLQQRSYDHSDNWLEGHARNGGTLFGHREQWWRNIVQRYFSEVEIMMRSALAPEGYGIEVSFGQHSLRQLEIYWELEIREANTVIRSIGTWLRESDTNAQIAVDRSNIGGTENAEWVRLELTQNIVLKIYAKTPERIRFELALLSDIDGSTLHEESSSSWLPDHAIWSLRHSSATRVMNVWNEIRDEIELHSDAALFFEWCAKIASVISGTRGSECLRLLVENGRIASTQVGGLASNRELRILADRGALERSGTRNRSGVYVVASEYRPAVASAAQHFFGPA